MDTDVNSLQFTNTLLEPGKFDVITHINPDWWWLLYGALILIAVIFFLTVLYHWYKYETNSIYTTMVVAINGIITLILLGSAGGLLSAYLI